MEGNKISPGGGGGGGGGQEIFIIGGGPEKIQHLNIKYNSVL